ncbi:MAG: heavy metal-binding domain-containing protein [Candidatus Brocadiia bacterium]
MKNRLKLLTGTTIFLLVLAGVYVYACCGEPDTVDSQAASSGKTQADTAKTKTVDDPNSPEGLLKTAAKILGDAHKSNTPEARNALMTHSQKMLTKALEMVTKCNEMLAGDKPDTAAIVASNETALKLMKKAAELMEKYNTLLSRDAAKTPDERIWYVCPMNCSTADKPGKCPKCGMNLVKKEPAEKAIYACPMGCVAPVDKPGKCPKCGMNLVKKESSEKAVYACPMNCETSDKPGKCSKCGMNLEKK